MKKVKIGIFNSSYSLLIFLIKFGNENIMLLKGNELNVKIGKKIFDLRKYKIKFPGKNVLITFIEKIYLKTLFFNLELEIYGQDHIRLGNILVGMGDFYLIEDGSYSYNNYKKSTNKFKNIVKKIIGINSILGRHKNIKKIYLTGIAPIPKEIAHKVEVINLKELWNKKTLEEQNEILDIFSFDLNVKEKIKGRDLILFTQPLSEDKVITEKEKIEIYSKIIKKYPKDKLIIKTHPREKTNYKEIFKEYLILDNPFPFEILNLLDVKFNKAITLFSTAALGLGEKVEVDFYGTEVHPKILERFGSCDNIMKRNCFLKEE